MVCVAKAALSSPEQHSFFQPSTMKPASTEPPSRLLECVPPFSLLSLMDISNGALLEKAGKC